MNVKKYKELAKVNVLEDELFKSFNVEVKNEIVSINIDTTKLLAIKGLIDDKNKFLKGLEFVLTGNGELLPGLIAKAVEEINYLSKINDNILYKLKMKHPFFDNFQFELGGTTFDENDTSDLVFDKIEPGMYVAVVAYEDSNFNCADFIKVKMIKDKMILLEDGQVFNANGDKEFNGI
ncbi:hypothetical protein [Clostridium estertheticum]|uniref:hypothetical protein n=1 Tax=Clostridium estertheticum TaxID=238834 RepID=UPI001C0AF5A2|nr:hypothetical protein [Clostridium estertheticum]MBU3173340.1 hypothetical protein [Clostridium estertheticum]